MYRERSISTCALIALSVLIFFNFVFFCRDVPRRSSTSMSGRIG